MIEISTLFAFIVLLASSSVVVHGYSSFASNIAGSVKQHSLFRLSASLKPQLTKLIARQDLTTAETEVCRDEVTVQRFKPQICDNAWD